MTHSKTSKEKKKADDSSALPPLPPLELETEGTCSCCNPKKKEAASGSDGDGADNDNDGGRDGKKNEGSAQHPEKKEKKQKKKGKHEPLQKSDEQKRQPEFHLQIEWPEEYERLLRSQPESSGQNAERAPQPAQTTKAKRREKTASEKKKTRGQECGCAVPPSPPLPAHPVGDWAFVRSQCLACNDPLLIKSESNGWCHVLQYRDINYETLLQLAARVPCYFPWQHYYDVVRKNFNNVVNYFPAGIAMCENSSQVREAVVWARDHRMPVSVRSGGHSFENFSLTTGLVVDVSRMNHVEVDAKNLVARIGAGAVIGHVVLALEKYGLALPTGTCANVGIAGLTLGGGTGFLDRLLGLTCDSMLRLKMVLANGEEVTVDAERNADLFWACKGAGGGNFGIVTEFIFRLYPIKSVVLYEIHYGWENALPVAEAWQRFVLSMPRNLTSEINFHGPGNLSGNGINVSGQWEGSKKELERVLQEQFLGPAGSEEGRTVKVFRVSFADAARYHTSKIARPPFLKNKSSLVFKPISTEGLTKFIERQALTRPGWFADIIFSATGGAITDVSRKTSSWNGRSSIFWIEFQSYAESLLHLRPIYDWMNETYRIVAPYVSSYVYVNFVDLDLKDWKHAYWGKSYPRLVEVKRKYDPQDFFHQPQGIRLEEPEDRTRL